MGLWTPELEGTRLPDSSMGEPGPGWDAWEQLVDGTRETIAPLGAYMKVLNDGKPWCWYVRLPSGVVCSIGWKVHKVEEHDDGTITVNPSIYDAPDGWHGWLQRGVWKSV